MYGDSRALATDSTAIFPSDSKPKREQIEKSKELLLHPNMNTQEEYRQLYPNNHHHHQNHHQQSNSNSGLLRFRSAPSSLLSNFTNDDCGEKGLAKTRSSSPENIFQDLGERKLLGNGYCLPPQYPGHSSLMTQLDENSSYRVVGSNGVSNLMRQSSSPGGIFSHLSPQNGYASLRGLGNYRVGNVTHGDVSPSSSRLRGPMNFSSGAPSSLGILSQISEIEDESVGYAFGSWNESPHFPENFSVLKRELDEDGKLFAGSQNGEIEHRSHILSHHLSLAKTSAEMAAMEKLLQFQDTVPCKVRAKRGCATHPRSIAERVRRTRISERMRKLQDLVPNMDKQTNTADMLDLAVDYIKELQKQYKILSEIRANCKCSSIQKPIPNLSA